MTVTFALRFAALAAEKFLRPQSKASSKSPKDLSKTLLRRRERGRRKRLKDNYEFPIAFIALHWRLWVHQCFTKQRARKLFYGAIKHPVYRVWWESARQSFCRQLHVQLLTLMTRNAIFQLMNGKHFLYDGRRLINWKANIGWRGRWTLWGMN